VCVAVAAAETDFAGVGIDVELATALPADLHATVLRPAEMSSPTAAGDAKVVFAAKEAFFKLYHPRTGRFLDFLDATVRIDVVAGTFVLELRDGVPDLLGRRDFAGACGIAGGYCFAFVALRRER
jgi:4'-phosphopantetheinyl transferase EntD